MPELGEIKRGREIGYKNGWKYSWSACIDCGKERWVALQRKYKGEATLNGLISLRCKACGAKQGGLKMVGSKSSKWHGGKGFLKSKGYIDIWLDKSDFFYPMSNDGRVLEHRLAMARHLDRLLSKDEFVHHKNGVRSDNRLENLELTTRGEHIKDHSRGYADGYIRGLKDGANTQIRELQRELRLLRWQIREWKEAYYPKK